MELTGNMAPKCLLKWTAKGNLRLRFGFSKIKGSRVYLQSIWMKPDNKELMTQTSGLLQCPAFVIAMCNFPVVFNLFLDTDASLKSACLNRIYAVVLPWAARTAGAASELAFPWMLLQNRTSTQWEWWGGVEFLLTGKQSATHFQLEVYCFVFNNVFCFKFKIFP